MTTPTRSRTKSSTRRNSRRTERRSQPPQRRRLRDLARHVRVPTGATTTSWPKVRAKAAAIGLGFDDWQDDAGRIAFAQRPDGLYAAGIGGVVLSIPRQVGKTYFVSAVVFALCLLTPGLTVLWTAHRMKTAGETFAKLQALTRKKKIRGHIDQVTVGSGDEVIYFSNGSRILFGARERGFGRGFDDVDIEVFDEAQILTEAALEDMVPATNVSPNPLIFFIGTPPRPKDPGEVFKQKRKDALAGDPDTVLIEFSADPGADEDDEKQWAKANPSYPHRTNRAAMLRMKKNLNQPLSFRREALGIWDDDDDGLLGLDFDLWTTAGDEDSYIVGALSFGVAMSPDKSTVAVAVCGLNEDGKHHFEVVRAERKSGWLFAINEDAGEEQGWLAERVARNEPVATVVDPGSSAGSLIGDIEADGVDVEVLTVSELVAACGRMVDLLDDGRLVHLADSVLNAAVQWSKAHVLPRGGWIFRPSGDRHITELMACVLALHGYDTHAEAAYDLEDSLG